MRLITSLLLWLAAATAHAAVVDYSYTPDSEVDLTIPTITGSPGCSGSSAENPNDADQYVIRDDAGLGNLNTTDWTEYFLCPGDYISAGSTSLTRSCSSGTPCWLIYYSESDPGTHPGTWDWNSSDRTHLTEIAPSGASWWRFVRIQWGLFNPNFTAGGTVEKQGGSGTTLIPRCSRPNNGSTDIVYHEVVCEGGQTHMMGPSSTGSNDRITIQRSVVRNSELNDNADTICINIMAGDDTVVVSNEVYNCTDQIMIETQTVTGTIIENNDVYITERIMVDCSSSTSSPTQDSDGECACFENMLDTKDFGSGSALADPETLIKGNRIHNQRDGHNPCGASGGGNGNVAIKSLAGEPAHKLKYWLNLEWGADYPSSFDEGAGRKWADVGNTSSNHSFIRNIWELPAGEPSGHIFPAIQSAEFFLNTIVNADWFIRFNSTLRSGFDGSIDIMCNTMIGVGTPFTNTGVLDAASMVGYNAYINSGATFEQGVTAGSDFEEATLSNMNFDDLRIEYKLLTEPTPPTKTFTQVVPTASTPSGYTGLCPGSMDTDTMGSRTGVGVDDDEADW